jgi:hypothetical protein
VSREVVMADRQRPFIVNVSSDPVRIAMRMENCPS